ncbi:hypothetical protein Fcan01_20041 [Folsomia candida]|uniref:Uncharacterized protein n=1 Tax=Folsomia candida TaxID=158441 RepID=A0A226DJR2_FOLCA|nr:hypothetical protein Fcan01_20041 [Folsomia candida]
MKNLSKTSTDLSKFFNARQTIFHASNLNISISQTFGYFPVSLKSKSHIPQVIAILISATSFVLGLWVLFSGRVDTSSHPSGTFKSVTVAWTAFIFITQSLSRLTLLAQGGKLINLLNSCISTVEKILQLTSKETEFTQFCQKLRIRYVKLISLYSLAAVVIALLQFRNVLSTRLEHPAEKSALSNDIIIGGVSIMSHLSIFSLLSLEFFCEIYNYCLNCIIASIIDKKSAVLKKNGKYNDYNYINDVLDSFTTLNLQVEECNVTYEGKIVIDFFFYFVLGIFRGYFASQLGTECCTVTSLVYFTIHLLSISVIGCGLWSIAAASTALEEKSGRFFRELVDLSVEYEEGGLLNKSSKLKILSAVTTYLVIVVQFQQNEKL